MSWFPAWLGRCKHDPMLGRGLESRAAIGATADKPFRSPGVGFESARLRGGFAICPPLETAAFPAQLRLLTGLAFLPKAPRGLHHDSYIPVASAVGETSPPRHPSAMSGMV
jgi:hypothetical protein